MGRVVKMIVTPVGLVKESIHARRDKGRPSEALEEDARGGDKAAVAHSGEQAERKDQRTWRYRLKWRTASE